MIDLDCRAALAALAQQTAGQAPGAQRRPRYLHSELGAAGPVQPQHMQAQQGPQQVRQASAERRQRQQHRQPEQQAAAAAAPPRSAGRARGSDKSAAFRVSLENSGRTATLKAGSVGASVGGYWLRPDRTVAAVAAESRVRPGGACLPHLRTMGLLWGEQQLPAGVAGYPPTPLCPCLPVCRRRLHAAPTCCASGASCRRACLPRPRSAPGLGMGLLHAPPVQRLAPSAVRPSRRLGDHSVTVACCWHPPCTGSATRWRCTRERSAACGACTTYQTSPSCCAPSGRSACRSWRPRRPAGERQPAQRRRLAARQRRQLAAAGSAAAASALRVRRPGAGQRSSSGGRHSGASRINWSSGCSGTISASASSSRSMSSGSSGKRQ